MKDYYLALGIEKDADTETIKKAYREYCKKYHPDSCDPEDTARRNEFLIIRGGCRGKVYPRRSDDCEVRILFRNRDITGRILPGLRGERIHKKGSIDHYRGSGGSDQRNYQHPAFRFGGARRCSLEDRCNRRMTVTSISVFSS